MSFSNFCFALLVVISPLCDFHASAQTVTRSYRTSRPAAGAKATNRSSTIKGTSKAIRPASPVAAPRREYLDSNTYGRSQRSFGINTRAGYFMGGILGVGAEVVYLPSSRHQYGFLYTEGRFEEEFEKGDSQYKGEATGTFAAAFGRYFLANTLNLTAGLAYRQIEVAVTPISESDPDFGEVEIGASGSSIGAMVAFGNLWTWRSGFNLGIDWVGYSQPITKLDARGWVASGTSRSEATDLWQDEAEAIALDGVVQALMLSLGILF